MPLPLTLAPQHRTVATLGDGLLLGGADGRSGGAILAASLGQEWRCIDLSTGKATSAEVRHFQLRRLCGSGTAPDIAVVCAGNADLAAAAVLPESLPERMDALVDNLRQTLRELGQLAPRGLRVLCGIAPTPHDPWPVPDTWTQAANQALAALAEQVRSEWHPAFDVDALRNLVLPHRERALDQAVKGYVPLQTDTE